ncbi:MAG: SDR family oxidoreductase [SAR202 cluster bacterium]|nr:SDR family oxidoreductase [SAR202 cluster bacterium]
MSKGRFKQEDLDSEGRGLVFGFGEKNNESNKPLDGKVAVITGSGRGIGRGIALELSKLGASIVVNDVGASLDGSGNDTGPAQSVVEEISELGGRAVASTSSVATVAGGKEIIDKAMDEFGRLDIVITPAGILRDRMIFNMTKEEWQDVIDVHLTGTFSVVAPASKIFREQKSGRIITFSSVSGLIGYSGQSNYGAAKDGIAGFTRVVAKELGKYGVTANAISPGANTRMTQSIPDSTRAMRVGSFKPAEEDHFIYDPEDVAPVVAWLCTDSAGHINGEIVHAVGNRISLFNKYETRRSITKAGRWTVEELANAVPETFGPELINPAPPQE